MSELPSANAIAHVRTRPVTREMSVAADMSAVDLATEECVSSETLLTGPPLNRYNSMHKATVQLYNRWDLQPRFQEKSP